MVQDGDLVIRGTTANRFELVEALTGRHIAGPLSISRSPWPRLGLDGHTRSANKASITAAAHSVSPSACPLERNLSVMTPHVERAMQ